MAASCATTRYVTTTCPIVDLDPAPELKSLDVPSTDGNVVLSPADALALGAYLETVYVYRNAVNQCPAIRAKRSL